MNVVTGLRRSGTSLMMLALKTAGIPIIGKDASDKHNPMGYWETASVARGVKRQFNGVVKVTADALYFSEPDLVEKTILMLRDPRTVIQSQLDVGIIPKLHLDQGIAKNTRDLKKTLDWLTFKPHLVVEYEKLIEHPKEEMKRVCDFMGEGDYLEGAKVVDKKLNRSNPIDLSIGELELIYEQKRKESD